MLCVVVRKGTVPRGAALQQIWDESGIDAPAFVGREGRLLARAVKCLLDPLVLRPRHHRQLAGGVLDDDGMALLRSLLGEARPALESADQWFGALRRTRRRLGITDGNIQELYFPRAYELAVTCGTVGADADAICAEALAEIHDLSLPTVRDLTEAAGQAETISAIEAAFERDWVRPLDATPDVERCARHAVALFDGSGEAWDLLLQQPDADLLGQALRAADDDLRALLGAAGLPHAELAVSATSPMLPPPIDGDGTDFVLDRPVLARARSALRRLRGGWGMTTASDLLVEETDRALASWGLHDRSLRAAFILGIVMAAGLAPLHDHRPGPRLVAQTQARLRAQSYVLHLHRLLAQGQAIHPGQARVVQDLAEFWRPYLNRLWARLHGRDVVVEPVTDGEEVRDLLTGIALSVAMDLRAAIRASLERSAA